ncbi:MAG: exo-alpha-sialidase [Planctomycetes bacterium]|nr:exo-alpha-sialidase [Planctomycetota bacterium]
MRLPYLIAVTLLAAVAVAQVPPRAQVLNPTGRPYEPKLVRVGDRVHACGYLPDQPASGFIDYARSDDGGRTWPVLGRAIAYAEEFDGVAADGDTVVALVNSRYFGPHTITSLDGGQSWSLPVRISQQSGPNPMHGACLAVSGATVNVSWFEDRGAAGRAFANRSLDGGMTWQPSDTRLDAGATTGPLPLYFYTMRMFGDGPVLNVLWDHSSATGDVVLQQRSADGGASWLPVAATRSGGWMQCAGGDGSLLLFSPRGSNLIMRSGDGGATWAALTNHAVQSPYEIAVEGAKVLVVGGVGSPFLILETDLSQDGGLTWLATPFAGGQSYPFLPHALIADGTAFVTLVRSGAGPAGTVLASDTGVAWRPLRGDAGLGLWAGDAGLIATTRTATTGFDLYAYVMAGHDSLGAGSPGTGGIVPRLEGSGLPLLAHTFRLRASSVRGGAVVAFHVSFDPPISVPLGAATLYLQRPIGPFTAIASGANGAAAVGTAAKPIAVPPSASLVGLGMVSQAFVLDAGAPFGFCATRAVETWFD